jgi:hypothetical protein
VPSYASVLVVGKNYKLRYFTKDEFRARVTGESADKYLLTLLERCALGDAYEEVGVDKMHVKLLEELPG